jgi:hypothetical protein
MRSRPSFVLAGSLMFAGPAHAGMEPTCKPSLIVQKVALSEVEHMHRTWTAHILVDATRCATASGPFTVAFIRLKDNAPDLQFTQPFTWAPGAVVVSTDVAADEAVLRYSISVAECPCR